MVSYERASLLVTSNLPFGDWGQVFHGERMTAALLGRLTRRCEILDMSAASCRFKESATRARGKRGKNEDSLADGGHVA